MERSLPSPLACVAGRELFRINLFGRAALGKWIKMDREWKQYWYAVKINVLVSGFYKKTKNKTLARLNFKGLPSTGLSLDSFCLFTYNDFLIYIKLVRIQCLTYQKLILSVGREDLDWFLRLQKFDSLAVYKWRVRANLPTLAVWPWDSRFPIGSHGLTPKSHGFPPWIAILMKCSSNSILSLIFVSASRRPQGTLSGGHLMSLSIRCLRFPVQNPNHNVFGKEAPIWRSFMNYKNAFSSWRNKVLIPFQVLKDKNLYMLALRGTVQSLRTNGVACIQ